MMNPFVPQFLPIPCFVQPDLSTKRRRYRRSRLPVSDATQGLIQTRHAAGKSLRVLATELGVNHETTRAIVHEGNSSDG